MRRGVEYPITMHVDNIGDILLSKKKSVSQRTKQTDARHHKTVKNQFFHSEENLVDQFTDNLSNGPFEFVTLRYVHHD